jgi:hypothetical protein
VFPCLVLSCLALSCPVLSCPVLSCPVLSCLFIVLLQNPLFGGLQTGNGYTAATFNATAAGQRMQFLHEWFGMPFPMVLLNRFMVTRQHPFLSRFVVTMMSLPRQTRDTNKGKVERRGRLSQVDPPTEITLERGYTPSDTMSAVHDLVASLEEQGHHAVVHSLTGETTSVFAMPSDTKKPNICQDRLGTNIGKTQKKGRFLREARYRHQQGHGKLRRALRARPELQPAHVGQGLL